MISLPLLARGLTVVCLALLAAQAAAELPVARVKSVLGLVQVERGGQLLPVAVGMALVQTDVVLTGPTAAVGLTFEDGTLFSLGADSHLAIDQFRFDRATQRGELQTTLSRGRMAVVSGKIAKSQVDAMKIRTPTSVLGVRGTEFVVDAGP